MPDGGRLFNTAGLPTLEHANVFTQPVVLRLHFLEDNAIHHDTCVLSHFPVLNGVTVDVFRVHVLSVVGVINIVVASWWSFNFWDLNRRVGMVC